LISKGPWFARKKLTFFLLIWGVFYSFTTTAGEVKPAPDIKSGGVSQLGHLTVIGADPSGNQNLTIPPYKGEAITPPINWKAGEHYEDPFESDQPVFNINAKNLSEFKDKLALGQQILISRNRDYQLPIYQTRRSATFPEFILSGSRENKKTAKLANNGNSVAHFKEGIPFPALSKNTQTAALQAIWNHITRYRGGSIERTVIQTTVFDDGDYVPIRYYQRYTRTEHLASKPDISSGNILFYYLDRITSPSRLSGTTLLIHETLDQSEERRLTWLYNKDLRRVHRAPGLGYDTPAPGTYGLRTADSYDMFNGSPDKYDWQYHGKQELYIPYNAYKLSSSQRQYDEILHANAVNPAHTRWELHRVHKIEAILKDGQRHIYGKRVFYLDEDTWTIVLAEQYDNRGELWRIAEGHMINYYDHDLNYYAMEVTYDLLSGRYFVFGLSNEESFAYKFNRTFKRSDYTPAALRRSSRG